jgi:hypothetical protein
MAQAGVCHIRVNHLSEDGESLEGEVKAWDHGNGHVLWELRRILDGILGAASYGPLAEWLGDRKARFAPLFHMAGLHYDQDVIPSRRSAEARIDHYGLAECPGPAAQHEAYSLTSAGLLVFVRCCIILLRPLLQRRQAKHFLLAIFAKLVPSDVLADHGNWQPTPEEVEQCDVRPQGQQYCAHMAPLMCQVGACLGTCPQHAMAEFWCGLGSLSGRCMCARQLDKRCVQLLSAMVAQSAPEVAYTRDPTKAVQLDAGAGRKRRRVDEDYKAAVISKGLAEGTGSLSSSQFLASQGEMNGRNAARWAGQAAKEYQAAAWLSFSGVQALHYMVDGSRVGQPAREYEVGFAWSPGFGPRPHPVGAWLPPQVIIATSCYQC